VFLFLGRLLHSSDDDGGDRLATEDESGQEAALQKFASLAQRMAQTMGVGRVNEKVKSLNHLPLPTICELIK